jgi:hypothetical protein
MRALNLLFLLLAFNLGNVTAAENRGASFHVQLIHGSEEAKPREASWRPVGPKVNKKLASAFRPKNYWEVNRVTLTVSPGKSAKARLSSDREIEIELFDSGLAETRVYFQGKLQRKCRQATHDKICIMGGTRDAEESWFVAVSREMPE